MRNLIQAFLVGTMLIPGVASAQLSRTSGGAGGGVTIADLDAEIGALTTTYVNVPGDTMTGRGLEILESLLKIIGGSAIITSTESINGLGVLQVYLSSKPASPSDGNADVVASFVNDLAAGANALIWIRADDSGVSGVQFGADNDRDHGAIQYTDVTDTLVLRAGGTLAVTYIGNDATHPDRVTIDGVSTLNDEVDLNDGVLNIRGGATVISATESINGLGALQVYLSSKAAAPGQSAADIVATFVNDFVAGANALVWIRADDSGVSGVQFGAEDDRDHGAIQYTDITSTLVLRAGGTTAVTFVGNDATFPDRVVISGILTMGAEIRLPNAVRVAGETTTPGTFATMLNFTPTNELSVGGANVLSILFNTSASPGLAGTVSNARNWSLGGDADLTPDATVEVNPKEADAFALKVSSPGVNTEDMFAVNRQGLTFLNQLTQAEIETTIPDAAGGQVICTDCAVAFSVCTSTGTTLDGFRQDTFASSSVGCGD